MYKQNFSLLASLEDTFPKGQVADRYSYNIANSVQQSWTLDWAWQLIICFVLLLISASNTTSQLRIITSTWSNHHIGRIATIPNRNSIGHMWCKNAAIFLVFQPLTLDIKWFCSWVVCSYMVGGGSFTPPLENIRGYCWGRIILI